MLKIFFLFLFCCMGFLPRPKPSTASLSFRFQNRVDGLSMLLKDSLNRFRNAHGDDFYVTTFKYYISNVSVISKNGDRISIPDSYFLMNAADSASLH